MDSVYSTLATRALQKHQSLRNGDEQQRTVIALAGPPGSGKSSIAKAVVQLLNEQASIQYAIVLPMDGFHLPREALDALPNKAEAYARRGAAWTYDAVGVLNLVHLLHQSKMNMSEVILAPSFDHVLKDPFQGGIVVTPDNSLIILEGNWLLLDEEPWRQISRFVDDTWFVDVAPELARERIAKRHIESGIESSWDEAINRAESNDLLNGDEVRTRLVKPALVIQSVEI